MFGHAFRLHFLKLLYEKPVRKNGVEKVQKFL